MRRAILALAIMAWASALADAQPGSPQNVCQVPDYLTHVEGRLARVSASFSKKKKLEILVIGSGSSSLAGPDGARNAYPARLEVALSARLANAGVTVKSDVKLRRTATEMASDVSKMTLDAKPNLVVWQTGTVDAMRGVDPDEFRATLEKGIAAIKSAGADVILVNMQYSPRTQTMIAVQAYADAMHSVAQQTGVPLFDRQSVMKHWSEAGVFDLNGSDRAVAERVHDCLGKLMAELIVDNAQLNQEHPRDDR